MFICKSFFLPLLPSVFVMEVRFVSTYSARKLVISWLYVFLKLSKQHLKIGHY